MNEVQTVSEFVKPYPQPALGGELGLTSLDVAAALGARHSHVKDHVNRLKLLDPTFAAETAKLPNVKGRPTEIMIFAIDESKMVVAAYQNEIGLAYLRFLIECERVATELTPQLIAQNQELRTRIEALEQLNKPKALPPKGPKKCLYTVDIYEQQRMFGEESTFVRTQKRIEEAGLTELDKKKTKLIGLISQAEGVARSIRETQDFIDFHSQPTAQKLQLIGPTSTKKVN